MADVILRSLVQDRSLVERVEVTSSGTGGWHVGDGADPRTVAVLGRHGYDGAPHRAGRFDPSDFSRFDLIVAMDRSHVRDLRRMAKSDEYRSRIVLLRDFDSEAGDEVPDPYYGADGDFEEVFAMVERSVVSLLDAIEASTSRSR
jgi:protein-tyrosine phosphatase